jgi:hypothetical protein
MKKILSFFAVLAVAGIVLSCNGSSDADGNGGDSTGGKVTDTTSQVPVPGPVPSDTSRQQQGDWKAWVNSMPGTSKPKLIVTGSFLAGPEKVKYALEPANPQGINPKILILQVIPDPTTGTHKQEMRFEQELGSKDQYTSLEIRIPGRESIMINKIEEAQ